MQLLSLLTPAIICSKLQIARFFTSLIFILILCCTFAFNMCSKVFAHAVPCGISVDFVRCTLQRLFLPHLCAALLSHFSFFLLNDINIKLFEDHGTIQLMDHCGFCAFSRSTGQTIKRQTENLRVDYYVTRDFKSEYKGSALQQIEKNVEEDYVSNVRNNCWKERQTSE